METQSQMSSYLVETAKTKIRKISYMESSHYILLTDKHI